MNCLGRHDGEPEPAIDGEHLCRDCKRKLRYGLADIVELWPLLAVMLQPGGGGGGGRTKPGSRPACDIGVADIRDPRGTVTGQLRSWARVVIEDRQLAPRTLSAPQAAQLLEVHLDWLCAQPFVDEASAEIASCAHAVRQACRDIEPRWVVGTCAMPADDGQPCGGNLQIEVRHTPTWNADTDDYDRRSRVQLVCRACRDTWTEADLDGYMVVNDVWLPIDDAAHQLGVSRRTLNRHAAAGLVRRRRGMVSWADARAVMAQRGVE